MPLLIQLAIGLIFSGLIGFAAYRRGSLSRSGVVGAVIVGTAIFGFGGLAWGLVLITFFVTSSALSHYKESVKEKLAEKFDKGHQRDLWQALANGGAGAVIAGAYALRPDPLLLAAFVGAMATVNADTWATELGVLNARPPRLISTWKPVEVGTSGGVSMGGTLAALGGALVIGVAVWIFPVIESAFVGAERAGRIALPPLILVIAAAAGLIGSSFDSLLGATVQALYYCPTCRKETERKVHTCGTHRGTPTEHRRGWRWLNNDAVNFMASLFGAAVAAGLALVLNSALGR
jgi:uncharacterized protein (TIGR00297 family)